MNLNQSLVSVGALHFQCRVLKALNSVTSDSVYSVNGFPLRHYNFVAKVVLVAKQSIFSTLQMSRDLYLVYTALYLLNNNYLFDVLW